MPARNDHTFIVEGDQCYYFGEYVKGADPTTSVANDLIYNFKMSVEHRTTPRWFYKTQAVQAVGSGLARLPADGYCYVPVPPSEARGDPAYDDRLCDALRISKGIKPALDFREIVRQRYGLRKSHLESDRVSVEELQECYEIDEATLKDLPGTLVIVDDVLTAGRHFRAMSSTLAARFPDKRIVGIFICRRKPQTTPPMDWAKIIEGIRARQT